MPIGWQAIGQPKSGKVSKPRYEVLIFFQPFTPETDENQAETLVL